MADSTQPTSPPQEFDDAWYEDWIGRMSEGGGNVIVALGIPSR